MKLKLLTIASMMILTILQPIQASASEEAQRPFKGDMILRNFDAAVAAAAGNAITNEGYWRVLRDAQGNEIGRLPRRLPGGGLGSQGTLYGDCGSSFIEIYDDDGALTGTFETGFNLVAPAYNFLWVIRIEASGDSGGFGYEWEDVGPLFPSDDDWTSLLQAFETAEETSGYDHFAEVITGEAYLDDGRICTTLHPSAVETVY